MKPKQNNKTSTGRTILAAPEMQNRLRLEAGKFSLDIAKLVFGGVILAGLMKEDINYTFLFPIGLAIVLIFVIIGFTYISKTK